MLDDALVLALQRHWEEGFNAYDVDRVMEAVAEDVVFSSPFVPVLTGDPSCVTIDGLPAFREYIADSMRRVPEIRYGIDAAFVSTQTMILVYSCHFSDGQVKTGADSVRVNDDGKIVEWRSHYSFTPDNISSLIQD